EQVPRDRNRQRNASSVEILRDRIGRSCLRAAIDDPRQHIGGSQRIRRIADRPGPNRDVDGDCRSFARFLRDDGGTVGPSDARGREATGRLGTAFRASRNRSRRGHVSPWDTLKGVPYLIAVSPTCSGMNQPSVRFETRNISRATLPTSSGVVAAIRAGSDSKTSPPPIVLKYPSW